MRPGGRALALVAGIAATVTVMVLSPAIWRKLKNSTLRSTLRSRSSDPWETIQSLIELGDRTFVEEYSLQTVRGGGNLWKAVASLIKIRSTRAVPELISAIERCGPDMLCLYPLADGLKGLEGNSEELLAAAFIKGGERARIGILYALGSLGSVQAVPWIRERLKHPDAEIREWAALSAKAMGSSAADLVDDLIAALNDQNIKVQDQAILALGAIGPGAERAVPALILLFDDPSVRGDAERAVISIGSVAIPHLEKALLDPRDRIRSLAEESLRHIEKDNVLEE